MKTVLASTHVDSHGDQITLEALEQMKEMTNGPRKVRFGVDHNREFPPKGIIEDAEIVERDGEHLLIGVFKPYEKKEILEWDSSLVKEYNDTNFTFSEVHHDPPLRTEIKVDLSNFPTHDLHDDFVQFLEVDEPSVEVGNHFRKSQIPDPEIIFTIAKGTLLFYFLKPFAKKIGEEVGEEVAKSLIKASKKLYSKIEKAIQRFALNAIPKSRPIHFVFEFNADPHVELLAKTRDTKLVIEGLRESKLKKVKREIEKLSEREKIDKIQFILTKNGKWKFNYLLTKNGASIGRLEVTKKRDKRLNIILRQE